MARAAAMMGGAEQLAAYLNINHRVLQHYLVGTEPVPDVLVLQAIDVILDNVRANTAEQHNPTTRPT